MPSVYGRYEGFAMSWGYWGVVLGVAMMLLVVFVSFEIMSWQSKDSKTGEQTKKTHADSVRTKHAA